MDTNTTVVYSVTVRCTTRANSSSIDNSTGKKRQRSPSPTDNVPSKQSKKSPKRDGELQPQLAVSPSRSPTSATYRPASPSYSQNASHSYNDTDASSIHSSYNEQILINCDPANDVGYEADDETDDETVSLMSPSLRSASPPPDLSTGRSLYELLMSASDLSDGDFDDGSTHSRSPLPPLRYASPPPDLFIRRPLYELLMSASDLSDGDFNDDSDYGSSSSPPLRYASPPPDLSTGRSLYELLMSASDLTDGDFDDDSAYSSSSSPPLYPTSERHLENPINVPGPQSTGFNAPSLYNSMLPSSYSMAYWPYDLASSSYTPVSPTYIYSPIVSPPNGSQQYDELIYVSSDNEAILISSDDDHILISSDDDHILISSDDDHILISSDDEHILISSDDDHILISSDDEGDV